MIWAKRLLNCETDLIWSIQRVMQHTTGHVSRGCVASGKNIYYGAEPLYEIMKNGS